MMRKYKEIKYDDKEIDKLMMRKHKEMIIKKYKRKWMNADEEIEKEINYDKL